MASDQWNVNQAMRQGNVQYIKSGDNVYPVQGSTAGVVDTSIYVVDDGGDAVQPIATTAGNIIIAQREQFEFRPGSTTLSGGMVESGTRTGAAPATSGTVASSTYWGSWIQYAPLRSGLIDGKSTGGIIEGQITVSLACGAGTGVIAPTIQIANTADTAAPTTALALATTVTCTTAETYATYDINYLETDAKFNSVPFSVRMGAQHSQGGSTAVFRIMESSAIRGYFEPTG